MVVSRASVVVMMACVVVLVAVAAVSAYPVGGMSHDQFLSSVGAGGGGDSRPLVDVADGGPHAKDKFLRSFCRYCHSQPFFCGELLELCYARFRIK